MGLYSKFKRRHLDVGGGQDFKHGRSTVNACPYNELSLIHSFNDAMVAYCATQLIMDFLQFVDPMATSK
jgi:hypothetical protein